MVLQVGSEQDLATDVPSLAFSFGTMAPGQSSSALFFAPASTNGSCAADPAALWSDTLATWESREELWSSITVPDAKLSRALQICQQTLLMMTETQHDGLRGLKSPVPPPSHNIILIGNLG